MQTFCTSWAWKGWEGDSLPHLHATLYLYSLSPLFLSSGNNSDSPKSRSYLLSCTACARRALRLWMAPIPVAATTDGSHVGTTAVLYKPKSFLWQPQQQLPQMEKEEAICACCRNTHSSLPLPSELEVCGQ